jgi:hypothetical protein
MSIRKTNQLPTIAWGSTICTKDLNVDNNEGVQNNGSNSLEDYELDNSNDDSFLDVWNLYMSMLHMHMISLCSILCTFSSSLSTCVVNWNLAQHLCKNYFDFQGIHRSNFDLELIVNYKSLRMLEIFIYIRKLFWLNSKNMIFVG